MYRLFIKAKAVSNYGNGIYAIELPSREPNEQERKVLLTLFPRLSDQAYRILQQEALLDSLASPADMATVDSDYKPSEEIVQKPKVR